MPWESRSAGGRSICPAGCAYHYKELADLSPESPRLVQLLARIENCPPDDTDFIEQIERGGQGNDLDTGVPGGEAGIPP